MVGSLAASDGSVWFGTYEGGLIHIKNGQFTNYRATGDTLGLANNNVWTVYEDQWGNIWIGTLGGGVQRIDKKTGRFTTLNTRNSKLPSDYISTITRTKKGWLMVSHSKYYSLINPKTLRIVNRELTDQHKDMGVIEMSITAMEDSRGLAWQGTTSGASVWNPKTGEVYMLNIRSGLYGNTVNGIIEDGQHTMWLVTDYGISNVVVQQQDNGRYHFLVRSFNNRDGLQIGPYNQRSICDTKTGVILVGGQGGLDILNPKSMSENRVKEIPLFSGLQVADRDVVVGEEINGRVILEKALNECRKLSLSYKDQFTVQLASNSGEIHNPSRFVYMLEGVNEDWVKTSEVNPNISFMSLRYGDYTLRVRMLNDDGTIGEDEISLDIHVAAPFWRARWAMLFYVLAVLAAVWLWRRYFLRRQKERMELEQQLREMEKIQWMNDMRAQLMKEGVTLKQAPETPQEKLFYQPVVDELVNFARTAVEGYKMPEEKACKLSFSTSLNRLTMRFDPVLLTRLFEILISNATKFSPRGSRIKVSLAKVDNMAEIRVADRGLGIPDDARSHLFDEHAGIGLDVVKRIVDMHGGTARAEDNPDGGTIFVISLPADIKPEDDAPIEYAVQMDD
jgi:signal transduction histidine kinase/streptogramin lyase